jgi:hypothetical protein
MVNYTNGKVYKIGPIVEMLDEGDIYIGSTCKEYLSQRMDTHRQKYRQWKKGGKTGKIYSYDLFDKYGINNCKITLLEVSSCNSVHELKARESHYIRTMKCVNKYIPNRTEKDWVADNKEHLSNYRKNYKIANIEHMTMLSKITYDCECGVNILKDGKRRHYRSKMHLRFVAEKKSAEEDLLICHLSFE